MEEPNLGIKGYYPFETPKFHVARSGLIIIRWMHSIYYWFPCGTGVWDVGGRVWAGRALTIG